MDLPTPSTVSCRAQVGELQDCRRPGSGTASGGARGLRGAVFEKGSPLVGCVDEAIDKLTVSG
ncbi:hypothetical protein [Streptosporangium vulgare]|uniref:hypothetical protein n=1 Tax=Streptosporangium vulgare TaxID=46190 RepID=UPI0031DCA806